MVLVNVTLVQDLRPLSLLCFEMLAAVNQLMELRYHQLEKELRDNDGNNFFVPINNSTQRYESPSKV